jgi:WD40 repeat protein
LRVSALGVLMALALLCLQPHASPAQGLLPTKWLYSPIDRVYSLAYSPDGTLLAVGGAEDDVDAGVQIHTLATGAIRCLQTAANDVVNAIAFSPDGSTLAVGGRKHTYSADFSQTSYSGVLELWNVATGKRIATLDTGADYSGVLDALGGVNSVAFSPNGKTLAAGGNSTTTTQRGGVIVLWNVSSRTRIRTLPTSANNGVNSVAFSPNGSLLASGGATRTGVAPSVGALEVWNTSDGTLFESLKTAANESIASVAFAPDGKTLAAGGQSHRDPNSPFSDIHGVAELWNVSTGALLRSFGVAARTAVTAVAFSPDGKTLADFGYSAGVDTVNSALEVWSLPGGSRIAATATGGGVFSLAFSPDGKTIAYDGEQDPNYNGEVVLWNVSTQTVVKTIFTAEFGPVQSVALSPDGKLVAAVVQTFVTAGSSVNMLAIRNAADGTLLASQPTAANLLAPSLTFSPDGKTIALAGQSVTYTAAGAQFTGVLELWSVATGKRIAALPTTSSVIVNAVAFSPDGKILAVGGQNATLGVLELWNVAALASITSQVQAGPGSFYTALAFSPDGATLAVGGGSIAGGLLDLWNVAAGERVGALTTSANNGVSAVAFSPNGKTLAVAGTKTSSNTAVLELLDLPTGTLRASVTPTPATNRIHTLAFSPHGNALFMGRDSNLQVFSALDGSLRNTYFQYFRSDGPTSVAVSSGGLLAYGTPLGTLAVASAPYSNTFLDFNGDGSPDLLLQNSTTGAISAWYRKGTAGIGSAPFSLTPPANYALVGVGDFAGDGTPTLVLQDRSADTIAFWYAGGPNNTVITGGDYVSPPPFAGWKVVGVGDFNGDGKSDLVFQNRTTHQVVLWFMDGPVYLGGASLPYTPPAGWDVVGVGDFNGDGFADLVFQNHSTGRLVVWFMNGVNYLSGTTLASSPGPAWKVVGVDDYHQDGSTNLLFQNRLTNQAMTWNFQGTTFLKSAVLSPILSNGWSIVGPR